MFLVMFNFLANLYYHAKLSNLHIYLSYPIGVQLS